MSVLVLSERDLERLLPMEECVEVMAEALAALEHGDMSQPLRFVFRPDDAEGLMGLMPAHRSRPEPAFGLKAVCVFPGNAARGLDAHQGTVLLFDGETGELRAALNASAITAIRTAAVSAVATRLLAREDARELAVLGAGVQARSHLEAMAAARPFERARIWSPTRAHAEAVASEASTPFPVEAAASAEEAVREADVVCTTTTSREPVLRRAWLAPGTHVNAVGSSIATTRELDTETMAAASLFVDRRESTLNEAGDFLFPRREGAIGPDHIRAELGELLTGRAEGRTSPDELTVFKSLGLAVEDLAAAEHVVRRAREEGAGTEVEL
ncbi:MAG TPA: ornithine cyclodeaminase family protein [Gaiellaceae bacterium]|nr:ornithine cyclodeaminase family protein [Gaiellaceae bacterium]